MGKRVVSLLYYLLLTSCLLSHSDARTHHARTAEETSKTIPIAVCPRKHTSVGNSLPQTCSSLVDHKSPQSSWGPWTHRPYCIVADDQEAGYDQENAEDNIIKYCVFTSSFFGNHGISIIARPETAANVAGTLEDAYHSDFPGPTTVQNLNLKSAYKVVDMPAKGGKGVVATRPIQRLETFMIDHASIVADVNTWAAVSYMDSLRLLHHAAKQLVAPDEVMALSRRGAADNADTINAIMKTNTFRNDLAGWPQTALFPLTSRINHACSPNAFLRLSSHGLSVGVAAFRDIQPGEEITISYIPLMHNSEERRFSLQQWGFNCTCPLCSAPEPTLTASNLRRAQLANITDEISSSFRQWDLQGAVRVIERGLGLLREEDLEAASGELYKSLALIHWVLGDESSARENARRAVDFKADFGLIEPSDRAAEVEEMIKGFDS